MKNTKAEILRHHDHLQMPAALLCLLCRNPTPLDANIPQGACAAHTEQLPRGCFRSWVPREEHREIHEQSGHRLRFRNLLQQFTNPHESFRCAQILFLPLICMSAASSNSLGLCQFLFIFFFLGGNGMFFFVSPKTKE